MADITAQLTKIRTENPAYGTEMRAWIADALEIVADETVLAGTSTPIANNTDLDVLSTEEDYYCDSTTICNSLLNCPVTTRVFSLSVRKSAETGSRRTQLLMAHSTTSSTLYGAGAVTIWVRSRYNASTWGPWRQVLTSGNTFLEVHPETSASHSVRTVTIDGVTSWDDLLNKPLFIKAATYSNSNPATLTINNLPAKSLYFADGSATGGVSATPLCSWVRSDQVYCVVWTGRYLVVVTSQPERGSTSTPGLLKLIDSVDSSSITDAATPKSIKTVNDALKAHIAEEITVKTGTWVPTIAIGSMVLTGHGTYVRHGQMVTVDFRVGALSASFTASEDTIFSITGLPFSSEASYSGGFGGGGVIHVPTAVVPIGSSPNGFLLAHNSADIEPQLLVNGSTANITIAKGSLLNFYFAGSISYRTDDD